MLKPVLYAGAFALASLSFYSCDEDDGQIIDLEPNDEQLLIASNTNSTLTKIRTGDLNDLERVDIPLDWADSDGIVVRGDDAYIVDRTNSRLIFLDDVFDDDNENAALVRAASTASIQNGRGIAINRETAGSDIAVAQDANTANGDLNKIFRFRVDGDETDFLAEITVPFNTWGLEFDGSTLIAVVDNSDSLAVFENFDDSQNGNLEPTYYVQVDGITRTHGIAYGKDDDVMMITDIGDAGSDSDGGILIVRNWRDVLDNAKRSNVIRTTDHLLISGDQTLLGNPVDVAYDDDNNRIFVAERARDGGRVLAFDIPQGSGNFAPVLSITAPGASSVDYRD